MSGTLRITPSSLPSPTRVFRNPATGAARPSTGRLAPKPFQSVTKEAWGGKASGGSTGVAGSSPLALGCSVRVK
ncbi:hypothetical protein D9M68_600780 [compost metagenome]